MARSGRFLLRIPAIRRVLFRLAHAEANLKDQEVQIGSMASTLAEYQARFAALSGDIQRLSGEVDGGGAQIGSLTFTIADHQAHLGALKTDIQTLAETAGRINEAVEVQRRQLDDIGDRIETLAQNQTEISGEFSNRRELLQTHIAAIDKQLTEANDRRAALEAQVSLNTNIANTMITQQQTLWNSLNGRIEQLAAVQADLTQHVSPERRAALEGVIESLNVKVTAGSASQAQIEAVLHSQQMQLNEMKSAMQAMQLQLAGKSESQPRKVGNGKSFEDLAYEGQLTAGSPYAFNELVEIRRGHEPCVPTAPPLIFIHIPKAAGTTLNNIFMKNYKYRADSYGPDFFPRYFPSEFLDLVSPPETSDDRLRPAFFTGHIDLQNEIFRRMPGRYVAITLLRDPVERIVSHYLFNSSAPSDLQSAIQKEKLSVIDYFQKFRSVAIPLQYEFFAPAASSEEQRVNTALQNLESRVSLFGLQDDFDAFVVLLSELLGLPNIRYSSLNRTPPGQAKVTEQESQELRKLLAKDIEFYQGAAALYRKRNERLPFNLEALVKAFRAEQKKYSERRDRMPHSWHASYS